MNTKKKVLLMIIIGVLSFVLISDVIKLCVGYSYTWYGFITMMINVILLGITLDAWEQ